MMLLTLLTTMATAGQVPTAPVPPPVGVKVAESRVVFRTEAGFIVFALYPEVAPKTVEQFIRMAGAGVYNGICVPRIEKNFVMQFSAAESDRIPPLPENLLALTQLIPAEFSSTLKHERGTISMAREDNDVNSGRTSFSVLLGPAPHLDGKYTIFGHVEFGMDVVEELIKAPKTGSRPARRVVVNEAAVVLGKEIYARPPQPAKKIYPDVNSDGEMVVDESGGLGVSRDGTILVCGGILVMMGLAILPMVMPGLNPKRVRSLQLMVVLVGAFLLLGILKPVIFSLVQSEDTMQYGQTLALVLFFGLLGMFRLMSSFESPVQ